MSLILPTVALHLSDIMIFSSCFFFFFLHVVLGARQTGTNSTMRNDQNAGFINPPSILKSSVHITPRISRTSSAKYYYLS